MPMNKTVAMQPEVAIISARSPSPHQAQTTTKTRLDDVSNAPNLPDTNEPATNSASTEWPLDLSAQQDLIRSYNESRNAHVINNVYRRHRSSPQGSVSSLNTDDGAASTLSSAVSAPHVRDEPDLNFNRDTTTSPSYKEWSSSNGSGYIKSKFSEDTGFFKGITIDLPSSGLSEEIGTSFMKFSNRGSMLIDGKKVNGLSVQSPIASMPMPMPSINEPGPEQELESETELEPEPERAPERGPELEPQPQLQPEPENVLSDEVVTLRKRASTAVAARLSSRVLSTDEHALSERVRSCYYVGADTISEQDIPSPLPPSRANLRWQDAATRDGDSSRVPSRAISMTDVSASGQEPAIPREEYELAGGLEDWQDVDNADVDRYGFIIPKSPQPSGTQTSNGGVKSSPLSAGPGLQRVATSLQTVADRPRRKHALRKSPSNIQRINTDTTLTQTTSNHSIPRPPSSRSLNLPNNQSTARRFGNKFPANKERRIMDEAADMLTLPRSPTTNTLTRTTAGNGDALDGTYTPTSTLQSRRKELEREDKWRKMATTVKTNPGAVGGGMTFTFDTSSSKLIERTWKGIPDTWRAAAWHSFLTSSANKHNKRHPEKPCLSDEQLMEMFHEYQSHGSPDDVQIDIDVPRTISSHIMFRRRYRGGQRLLFRVLHAMSVHFGETGYVQGMATLAATLLAYYEEEKAFIMLVRLWELRGLEKLYKDGFGGLMEALEDFENNWLGHGELREKLDELMISPTAYGTKWYLTLFNYSIPFPAQLRVWDVFMLLGDDDENKAVVKPAAGAAAAAAAKKKNANNDSNGNAAANGANGTHDTTNSNHFDKSASRPEPGSLETSNFGSTLDILHATSAALIDGMRNILLESDFENAMKTLTSWVPIRDEDVFMRVAKAEWKVHRGNRK